MTCILIYLTLFSNQKGIEKTIGLKHKSINNDKLKNTEIKPKIFGKKIKATFKVGAHHNKCCKSKLNNGMCIFYLYFNRVH